MKRVRWFSLSPISRPALKKALEGMRKEEFLEDSTVGFLIERARPTFIEARFVEKFERVETLMGPFGESREFQRTEHQITRFRLSTDCPQLEFFDAPRSVAPAINSLTALMEPETVVAPLDVDVPQWLALLDGRFSDLKVTSSHFSQISLSESVNAKIVLNGSSDVRSLGKQLVGRRNHKIERFDVACVYQGQPARFVLRDDARATLVSGDEDILEVLRSALAECL